MQKTLRKELLDALRSQDASDLTENADGIGMHFRILESLTVLEAVLLETLRLYPAGLGPSLRVIPAGGAKLGPFQGIPAGTVVGASAYTLHRNPIVFPDPEQWRPARWIESNLRHRNVMDKWFWPFGSGSRKCIGNHLATRLIKEFIAAIYVDFETTVAESGNMEQIDGLMGGPVGGKLILQFRAIKSLEETQSGKDVPGN
ncbi:hypothetical protein MMC25_006805 [Agyrium rufum]|nr:hypothetical protein [Agyrium rufum]